jgi:acetyltransferase-like isoleucine patch superfamily enzyme
MDEAVGGATNRCDVLHLDGRCELPREQVVGTVLGLEAFDDGSRVRGLQAREEALFFVRVVFRPCAIEEFDHLCGGAPVRPAFTEFDLTTGHGDLERVQGFTHALVGIGEAGEGVGGGSGHARHEVCHHTIDEPRPVTRAFLTPMNDSIRGPLHKLKKLAAPVAKRVLYGTLQPNPVTKPLFSLAFEGQWSGREVFEWARRSLVATPIFLSRCAKYGERIAVDRVPYMNGDVHIELGDDVRISGLIGINATMSSKAKLKIGNGVFIAHACSFAIADLIEIGDMVSIGMNTYIADTEGHSHYNPDKPIWDVPAGEADVAPVIIEEGVQISRNCMIMKGVRIGARSVIGAGSVVRSSIPPDSIVMGNPARVVKRMTTEGATAAANVPAAAPAAGGTKEP